MEDGSAGSIAAHAWVHLTVAAGRTATAYSVLYKIAL